MPMNLDPRLVAFDGRLERGALVRIHAEGRGATLAADSEVLRFQFNPETITRTRAGTWDPRKKRKRQGPETPIAPRQDIIGRSGTGSSALLAESEKITLRTTFDATEAVLRGVVATKARSAGTPPGQTDGPGESKHAHEVGVLPQLAFLELLSVGREGTAKRDRTRESVRPIRPDEVLLVLGRERMFPTVLTNLSITEQKFTPSLVPLRAEVELQFNVLEPAESAYSTWIKSAFDQLLAQRTDKASYAVSGGDEIAAIERALAPERQADE